MRGKDPDGFIDDLSIEASPSVKLSIQEQEADEWAQESLIPSGEWKKSGVSKHPTIAAVSQLAHMLGIHPAIVASRVRKEKRNYRILTQFVGCGEVSRALSTPIGDD